MNKLVDFSLNNRFLVLLGTLLLILFGVHALYRLPIDVAPDITPNQVLVLTRAPVCLRSKWSNFSLFPLKWP